MQSKRFCSLKRQNEMDIVPRSNLIQFCLINEQNPLQLKGQGPYISNNNCLWQTFELKIGIVSCTNKRNVFEEEN
jgi:hypothetical protein